MGGTITLRLFLGPVFLFFAILAAGDAIALSAADIQGCASIPNDALRLYCYDNLSRKLGIPTARPAGDFTTTQSEFGKWISRTEGEKNGQSPAVFALAFSENHVKVSKGNEVDAILVARCFQEITDLFLYFPSSHKSPSEVLENENLRISPVDGPKAADSGIIVIGEESKAAEKREGRVRLYFGPGREMDLSLVPSEDGKAWFFPNPVSILGQLKSVAKITLTGISGVPQAKMSFSLDGMTEALVPVRANCAW